MPSAPESMYLIDAHSLIFQVFHAIRDMTTSGGLPANALFGFLRDVLSLRARKPAYLIVAFDVTGPTFRDKLYPAYKANRGPMPDDLQPQIPLIYQALEALRLPVLGVPGYEADDVLATVGRAAADKGIDVFLCTSDKDCRQLLSDRIKMYNLRKGQVFGPEQLREDWGVTPEQVVDLQTLVGDSVDNVPGVTGVGVKTAAKLLQEFGTLDNLLGNLDKVKGKLKENLTAAVPKLPLSRKLVRLDPSVPIEMDWDGWRLKEWDGPKLLALFEAWGFRSMAREVRESLPATERSTRNGEAGPPAPGVTQRDLFDGEDPFPFGANAGPEGGESPMPRARKWEASYELVATPKKFEGFLKKLSKQKRIAFDLETTSLDPLRCEIVGLAFSWKEGEGYYLPVRGPEGDKVLDGAKTLEALKPIFEDDAIAKANQNVKYDLLVLRAHGVTVAGVVGDSMVADYLLHSGERSHGLDELSRRYLNHEVIPITDLIGKNKKTQITMDQVPTAKVAEYAGEDADVAWRLCALLEPQLETEGLGSLYRDVEIPLIEVLAELEYNGIRLDVPMLKRLGGEMGEQLEAIEKEIHQLAGHEFNIASLPQLRKVLFEELKLPVQRKTGLTNAPSTDQETLEKLATLTHLPGHRLPKKILDYRQVSKLKGTYVDALPLLINPKTSRLHTSFNQTVASTGRLSSQEPNLQNIPVRREQGQQIRQAFVPEEGWRLLCADYSQIELRLLAHFTGDETMRAAFAEDRDIHAAVATQIFGVEEDKVTPEMRRMAKTVNFGVIYGISPLGLGVRLGMKQEDAAKFIANYFAKYPKVLEYQTRLLQECHRTQRVGTILGRRRRIEGVRPDSTFQQRNQPEREAINMEVQGSAADLIKLAMLRVYRRLKDEKYRARMLLQIHDELVFETPPKDARR
jgi:DNA polymerase I